MQSMKSYQLGQHIAVCRAACRFHAANARGFYPQTPVAICLKMPVKNRST